MNASPAARFYDHLADDYDLMTRFTDRIETEKRLLKLWSDKFRFKRVLDAACGSGLHTIALGQMGIQATGTDISKKMIERARQNARELKTQVEFYHLSFAQLDQLSPTQFDTVMILGNSLPHLKSPAELSEALQSIQKILSPAGKLIIQILNYDKILKHKERIISINRHQNREFIRFYDFFKQSVLFNILSVDWHEDKATHSLDSTELYPFRYGELHDLLEINNFRVCEQYGSMTFDPYIEQNSKNCVLVAEI